MNYLRVRYDHPTWCGPVAVALLTGCTVNEAAQQFANVKNVLTKTHFSFTRDSSKSVEGVSNRETELVLDLLGFELFDVNCANGIRVHDFVCEFYGDFKMLIAVSHHYLVAHHTLLYDSNLQHVRPKNHPYGSKVVERAWHVQKKPFCGLLAMSA